MSGAQVAAMSSEQLALLPKELLGLLTEEQLEAVPPAVLGGLSPEHLSALSARALAMLSPEQAAALSPGTFGVLHLVPHLAKPLTRRRVFVALRLSFYSATWQTRWSSCPRR